MYTLLTKLKSTSDSPVCFRHISTVDYIQEWKVLENGRSISCDVAVNAVGPPLSPIAPKLFSLSSTPSSENLFKFSSISLPLPSSSVFPSLSLLCSSLSLSSKYHPHFKSNPLLSPIQSNPTTPTSNHLPIINPHLKNNKIPCF